jgi:hypothetical protein
MTLLAQTFAQQIAVSLVLAAILVSCWPGAPLIGAHQPTSPAEQIMSHDDLLVRVEERAPGFGGMFLAPDGALVIYLIDPSELESARRAIEAIFGSDYVPAAGVRGLQGQYSASQLKRWVDTASTGMLGVPGVTMVDLDEGRNRVSIGITGNHGNRRHQAALAFLRLRYGFPPT